eukprot:1086423-Rhodomonas_salina.1
MRPPGCPPPLHTRTHNVHTQAKRTNRARETARQREEERRRKGGKEEGGGEEGRAAEGYGERQRTERAERISQFMECTAASTPVHGMHCSEHASSWNAPQRARHA